MASTYTAEQRSEAVELYTEVGPSEVERRLGIPKATVRYWAKAEGCTFNPERTEAATAASVAIRKSALAERLLAEAEQAVEIELGMLESAPLRDLVGARTRAIHDLQLLSGEATQRVEDLSQRAELLRQAEEIVARANADA